MLTPDLQQEVLNNIAIIAKENGRTCNDLAISNTRILNSAFTQANKSGSAEQISAVSAAAFVNYALNNVVVMDIFNEGIDDFFNAPDATPIFADMTAEEKEESRRQLKNTVAERLGLNIITDKGRLFTHTIEQQFNNYMANNEGSREALRKDFMEKVLKPIDGMMDSLSRNGAVPSPAEMKQQFNDPVGRFVIDNIAENAAEFSAEAGAIHCTLNNMFMVMTRDSSITPASFLEHYNAGTLSDEEAAWAVAAFDSAHIEHTPDYASFMSNGKPLFSQKELELIRNNPALDGGLKVKAISRALAGDAVSERNATNGTVELLNPNIDDLRRSNRSVWDIIVDFFKDLLGIGAKENQKLQQMQEQWKENAEVYNKKSFLPTTREHIGLEELSGQNAIDRVTRKPVGIRQPTLSKEIAAPSKHK